MNIFHEWFDTLSTLFSDGSLRNPYTESSYKYFSRITSDKLLNKSAEQVINILKSIKFNFVEEIKVGELPSNSKEEISFDMCTFKDDGSGEITISTCHKLPYKICYESSNNTKKIISVSTNNLI